MPGGKKVIFDVLVFRHNNVQCNKRTKIIIARHWRYTSKRIVVNRVCHWLGNPNPIFDGIKLIARHWRCISKRMQVAGNRVWHWLGNPRPTRILYSMELCAIIKKKERIILFEKVSSLRDIEDAFQSKYSSSEPSVSLTWNQDRPSLCFSMFRSPFSISPSLLRKKLIR